MINTLWLKTFCTLVDVGHFTKTSNKLFMTQSGVSQHIKKLEQQLGTNLLIREGKRFSLTDGGEKLYQQGTLLLKAYEDLETAIKQNDPHIGVVKIASPGSVGLKLYTHLLDLQVKHPELIIHYTFAPNHLIEKQLNDHSIDIGLVTELTATSQLAKKEIALESLVLVTHKNAESVSWQALLKQGFMNHPDAEHHANVLLSKNFPEFVHINQFKLQGYSNQISLILEPVSRGMGFTVLPFSAVNSFNKQALINVHPLDNRAFETLLLCNNKQAYETKRIQYVQSVISQFLKSD